MNDERDLRREPGSVPIQGAVAGFLATLPMSAAMGLLYRQLPEWQQYPLPPAGITREMADRTDMEEAVDAQPERALSIGVGHFAYGTAAGAFYRMTMERLPLPPLFKGLAFGVGLWAVGYLGWVPALDLLPSATERPRQRTLLMIMAHLVYGVCTALISSLLKTNTPESSA